LRRSYSLASRPTGEPLSSAVTRAILVVSILVVSLGRARCSVRNPLATLGGLTHEAVRIYRKMKAGKMDHNEGRSLMWVWSQMRSMVEAQALENIERRLAQLAVGR
jgi:hypothetical protein